MFETSAMHDGRVPQVLLENPKLFSKIGDYNFHHNYITSQLKTVREYLALVDTFNPPKPYYQVVRSHLFRMLYRFVDAEKNKDLRKVSVVCIYGFVCGVV